MTSSASSVIWATVYLGLAAFFAIGGRRFERPGYMLMGLAMALLAVAFIGIGWLYTASGPLEATLAGRLVVLGATFAPAFNTHFLFYYAGRDAPGRELGGRRWETLLPQVGYVLAGAGWLADLVASLRLSGEVVTSPLEYISPAPVLSVFVTVVFVMHLALDAFLLTDALRRGRRQVLVPLITLLLLGPAVAFSYTNLMMAQRSLMLTQMLTWVYGLAVVWGLITELRGAEGLLEQTTSSLAERTAELQVSYAELELMHDELTRKQQLAAVGELAGSIAHEVRNPLAIIMNASSGLRRKQLSDADRETLLSIVDEEAERLNQLVTELLRFARPVEASRAPASLLDICRRVQSAAPEGYQVRVSTPSEESLGSVWVDPGLFRLALDNLMANATQAMEDGGEIDITVERDSFGDGEEAVALRVRDRGVGMRPEELERARKPFFTTKPRGSGLGLPIVERIVDAHGGELEIQSEYGRGTTVTLKVPVEQVAEIPPSGSKSPSSHRPRRSVPPSSRGTTRRRLPSRSRRFDSSSDPE